MNIALTRVKATKLIHPQKSVSLFLINSCFGVANWPLRVVKGCGRRQDNVGWIQTKSGLPHSFFWIPISSVMPKSSHLHNPHCVNLAWFSVKMVTKEYNVTIQIVRGKIEMDTLLVAIENYQKDQRTRGLLNISDLQFDLFWPQIIHETVPLVIGP